MKRRLLYTGNRLAALAVPRWKAADNTGRSASYLLATQGAPFSSSTSTDNSEDNSDHHCPALRKALPGLQARFAKLCKSNSNKDDDGCFPILSPTMTEQLHKRWHPDEYSDGKRAAVLIAIYSDNGVPSLLLTARSPHVPQNPSEISFPGGHLQSDADRSLEDTALRETQEELLGTYPWRDPRHLVILGGGTTIPSITGTPVTPIIAVMMQDLWLHLPKSAKGDSRSIASPSNSSQSFIADVFPGDKSEVDAVFGMPLEQLLREETSHELPDHRLLGKERRGPRYPTPTHIGDDDTYVWGLTAFMLRPLLHKLYRPVFGLKK